MPSLERLLEGPSLELAGAHRLGRVLGRGAQRDGDVAEQAVVLTQELRRGGSRDRLDAPYVGRVRALREDVKHADLSGEMHVRSTAQLARVLALADLHHAHHLAVLLAEQGHRAEALGLRQRRGDRAHGIVAGNPLVDAILHVAQLLGAQRLAVAEVKAELVRPDVGACLVHVVAQALAQRRLQQVRGGVVALGRMP